MKAIEMEERDLLIGILAATDAAHAIPRKNRTSQEGVARTQARRRYASQGGRATVPTSGRADEKAAERRVPGSSRKAW